MDWGFFAAAGAVLFLGLMAYLINLLPTPNKKYIVGPLLLLVVIAIIVAGLQAVDRDGDSTSPTPSPDPTTTTTESTPPTTTESTPPETVYLDQLEPIEDEYNAEPTDIAGTTYFHALTDRTGGCSRTGPVEWNVSGDYTAFTATAGLGDETVEPESRVNFSVWLDGTIVDSVTLSLGETHEFNVSITGGLRLRLEAILEEEVRTNCNTEAIAVWGDAAIILA